MINFALSMDNMSIIQKLQHYFSFDFVIYAVLVAVLISLCAALLGVPLVLKRYAMIGDGLSHIAFGASAVAAVLNVASLWVSLPITILCAILMLKSKSTGKIKGEQAIALLSVGALSIGYLLLNLTDTTAANLSGDVCSSLFGSTSILTLSEADVWSCIILAIIVIVLILVFYNKIFAVTFDEKFAQANGVNVEFYNLLTAIITATVIVIGMKVAGALLISALIIFPAISAMRLCKSYKGVILVAAIISVFCSLIGTLGAILFETPVGASIVVINIVVLLVFGGVEKIKTR